MSSIDGLAHSPVAKDDQAPATRKPSPDFIDALARGLEVIRAFSADMPEMTLTEVATKTGLAPATARRCLLTLKELGYVSANGRRFLLRSKVLSLGGAFLDSMHIRDVADAYLQDLAETFHEAASMAVLEDNDVVYIAHVPSRREARYRVRIGWRLPAYATSMGRVILAHLDPVAQEAYLQGAPFPRFTARTTTEASELRSIFHTVVADGYACVQDQMEYGAIAIAVPVYDAKGRVVAAINCSSETSRVNEAELVATRLPKLRQAAREISDAVTRYPALIHSITAD